MSILIQIMATALILKVLWIGIKPMICAFYHTKWRDTNDVKYLEKGLSYYRDPLFMMEYSTYLNNTRQIEKAWDVLFEQIGEYRGGIHKSGLYIQASAFFNNVGARTMAKRIIQRVYHYSPNPTTPPYTHAREIEERLNQECR